MGLGLPILGNRRRPIMLKRLSQNGNKSHAYKFEKSRYNHVSKWSPYGHCGISYGNAQGLHTGTILFEFVPVLLPYASPRLSKTSAILNLKKFVGASFEYEQNLRGENTKLSGLFGHCSKQVTQKSTGTCLVHKKLMITKCGDTNRCGDNLRRTRCKIGSPNLLAKHRPNRDHVRS